MWESALSLSVCAFLHLNLMINISIYRVMRDSRASEDAGLVDLEGFMQDYGEMLTMR